jgi:hypothetical protein
MLDRDCLMDEVTLGTDPPARAPAKLNHRAG